MSKTLKIICIILVICILSGFFIFLNSDSVEIKSVNSEEELKKLASSYSYSNRIDIPTPLKPFIYVPIFGSFPLFGIYLYNSASSTVAVNATAGYSVESSDSISLDSSSTSSSKVQTSDYSKTNVQVENVDEADIDKTDGSYIYSLSNDEVIITDVRNPEDIKVASKIQNDGEYPEDLLLYNDKLVVISEVECDKESTTYYWSSKYKYDTVVNIYDITNKENPKAVKSFKLEAPYYTSRAIGNMLYIISSGTFKEDDDKPIHYYTEDSIQKEIALNDIKYIDKTTTRYQTMIAACDLDSSSKSIKISDFLMDVENAYVSENAIYLMDSSYYDSNTYKDKLKAIFGIKGIFGLLDIDSDYSTKTKIFKFDIDEDTVKYAANADIEGKTINQYSLDEYNGNLRIATTIGYYDGAKVSVFDKNMKLIGESETVGDGEKMYSSRFVGDRVYLVTYKNTDPLFVIDLSDATAPKVLGKLKIPGYSTYLHPYDENHIIGIGMQTEDYTHKDSDGRVWYSTTRITGMKMALFDVSDVTSPKEISTTVIGDSRTTSAVLTNAKALLFSKEKQLIAIPVNTYSSNFSVETSSTDYSSTISSYTSYNGTRVSEGYLVYKINLEEGFKFKGEVAHNVEKRSSSYYDYWWYENNSRLLRGLYISNNLFTVSEDAIKVNDLDTLKLVDELRFDGKKNTSNTNISGDTEKENKKINEELIVY